MSSADFDSEKILIVEDSPTQALKLELILEDQGYQVISAGNGKEALQCLKDHSPLMVISDIVMPEMDGYELCRSIRSDEKLQQIPVILLTSLSDPEYVIKGLESGAHNYILKPFDEQYLISRIDYIKKSLQLKDREDDEKGVEIYFDNKKHLITSNRKQILDFLISTYEIALHKNQELEKAKKELNTLNNKLEDKVIERTKMLTRINNELKNTSDVFRKFVPGEFLKYLGRENIVDVKRGDQTRKTFTVLFSDIRSYAAISEKLTPTENFNFINSYIEYVGPAIKKNGGFIDKFIGDAVMALFPDDPGDAITAAVDMQKAVCRFNESIKEKGYPSFKVGIGLHTGSLILGTIGDDERIQTTVISDHVNLASRLEELTKYYKASILISESSYLKAKNRKDLHFRMLGKMKVKGKTGFTKVYEVMDGDEPEVAARKIETKQIFEKGLKKYFDRKFDEAGTLFRSALEIDPDDSIIQLYLQQSEKYLKEGVSEDWSGIEDVESSKI